MNQERLYPLDQHLQLIDDVPIELLTDLRHTVSAGDAEDHVEFVLIPRSGPLVDLESSGSGPHDPGPQVVQATVGVVDLRHPVLQEADDCTIRVPRPSR